MLKIKSLQVYLYGYHITVLEILLMWTLFVMFINVYKWSTFSNELATVGDWQSGSRVTNWYVFVFSSLGFESQKLLIDSYLVMNSLKY